MTPPTSHQKEFRIRALVGLFVASIAAMAVVASIAPLASAAGSPKAVQGYIWDNAKRPVDGANVTVNILVGLTVRSSGTDVSDSTGFYSVFFLSSEWDEGNTIELIAEYKGNQDVNSTSADAAVLQYVNLTFLFEIPQFGVGWVGFAAAGGAVMIVGAVVLMRTRKK